MFKENIFFKHKMRVHPKVCNCRICTKRLANCRKCREKKKDEKIIKRFYILVMFMALGTIFI
jgi:predicted RNase H-like nuclease